MSSDHSPTQIGLRIKGNKLAQKLIIQVHFQEVQILQLCSEESFSEYWLQLSLICLIYLTQADSNFIEVRWPPEATDLPRKRELLFPHSSEKVLSQKIPHCPRAWDAVHWKPWATYSCLEPEELTPPTHMDREAKKDSLEENQDAVLTRGDPERQAGQTQITVSNTQLSTMQMPGHSIFATGEMVLILNQNIFVSCLTCK